MIKGNLIANHFKKILIIDDDSIDRFILMKSLEKAKMGSEIIEASSGIEALEILTNYSINKLEIPELIFLDLNMPVLNGFEFLDALKQLSREYRNRCRIVVVSSFKNESDETRSLLYDYVIGYFEKPLKEEFFNQLKKQHQLMRAS